MELVVTGSYLRMSQNIFQIFTTNPANSLQATDLFYLGRSPYGLTDDMAVPYSIISAQFAPAAGSTSITTLGTVTTGTWNATIIAPAFGGTGINNGTSTITIGGNVSFIGAFTAAFTFTGNSAVTFPTTGTLATTSQLPTLPLSLTNGGTNASLVASNGGIVWSNATQLQILAGIATAGHMLQSGATATPTWSTATYPSAATNAARILRADGTNWVQSTSTFADTYTASAILYANGANNVAGLAPANNGVLVTNATGVPSILVGPGASGKVLQSNAAAAPSYSTPTYPSASGASGKILISDGTNNIYSTPTYPNASVTAGKILISDGTNYIASTPTYPNTSGGTGTVLRSNGTNNVYSTSTFSDTYTASNILYSNGANTVTGLATGNNGVLITSGGGVPSISSTLPAAVQGNITTVGTVTTGTWNGGIITGTFGGTGVNNGARTITTGGNVTFTGAFTFAGTVTGNTAVTFPTTGTLATTSQILSPPFSDATGIVADDGDPTKIVQIQAAGISAGTTRVWTAPNCDVPRFFIQSVSARTGTVATTTTAIPSDNTIPLIGEGAEAITVAITPTSASNILRIDATASLAHSSITPVIIAIFQDATSNSLAATVQNVSLANYTANLSLTFYMTAGTTSATTFRLRYGGNTGSTATVNGSAGSQLFGGVSVTSITVTEYSP